MAVPDSPDEASAASDIWNEAPVEVRRIEITPFEAPALLPMHLHELRRLLEDAIERAWTLGALLRPSFAAYEPTRWYDDPPSDPVPAPPVPSDPVFDPPKPPPEQDPGSQKGYRPAWAVPLCPRKPA